MYSYEYNTPIHFDGDIIITDPCYIMNEDNEDKKEYPSWWDFVSKSYKKENGSYYVPKAKDYPDARPKTFEDFLVKANNEPHAARIHQNFESDWGKKIPMISDILEKEWQEYRKAELAYQVESHDDWDRCSYGSELENLGLSTFLSASTIYGDWSCNTYNLDSKKIIGQFCADAGLVGVFLLDEVLKYNPNFDYHIKRPWTTTLIKDFHGIIELHLSRKSDNRFYSNINMADDEVEVIGKGNINFIGTQTDL